ncbi:MAG TPA: twin-arginine translocase TatA/TatE family subunit [Myxococcales bacterium]
MFNIGAAEIIIIFVAALLLLGPDKLPELARGIGKFMREFRRQTDEVRGIVEREFYQMDLDLQREVKPESTVPTIKPPELPAGDAVGESGSIPSGVNGDAQKMLPHYPEPHVEPEPEVDQEGIQPDKAHFEAPLVDDNQKPRS